MSEGFCAQIHICNTIKSIYIQTQLFKSQTISRHFGKETNSSITSLFGALNVFSFVRITMNVMRALLVRIHKCVTHCKIVRTHVPKFRISEVAVDNSAECRRCVCSHVRHEVSSQFSKLIDDPRTCILPCANIGALLFICFSQFFNFDAHFEVASYSCSANSRGLVSRNTLNGAEKQLHNQV